MSSRKMLNAIAILLAASFALAACGSAGGTQAPSGAPESSSTMVVTPSGETEPFALPFVTEPTTVVWATRESWYPQASYNSNLQAWEEIQERTGVTIEWQIMGVDYNDQMMLRLAAGTDLPDILRSPGNLPMYGASGVVLSLENLIDAYAPNIIKVWDENKPARQLATSADGHIYGVSVVMRENPPYHWQIRYDWLDNLGLDMPVTTDDWLDVFEAFKTGDPTGTNQAGVIPCLIDPLSFGQAFGVELFWTHFQFQARQDGRIGYKWADPRMPEILSYLKILFDNGYLWPEYASNQDVDSAEALIYDNRVGAYQNYSDWGMTYNDQLRRSVNRDDVGYTSIPPALGPRGDRTLEIIQVMSVGGTAISKDCKDPRIAMKMIDYLYSDEGQMYMAWGIEGITYEYGADGKPTFTDFARNNPDGLGISDVIRTYGGWPTTHWVQRPDVYADLVKGVPEFENSPALLSPFYHISHFNVAGTVEEQDELAQLLSDLNTHRAEQIFRFISGSRPISEFDQFVNELKAMGMERAEEIEQIKYERFGAEVDFSSISFN